VERCKDAGDRHPNFAAEISPSQKCDVGQKRKNEEWKKKKREGRCRLRGGLAWGTGPQVISQPTASDAHGN